MPCFTLQAACVPGCSSLLCAVPLKHVAVLQCCFSYTRSVLPRASRCTAVLHCTFNTPSPACLLEWRGRGGQVSLCCLARPLHYGRGSLLYFFLHYTSYFTTCSLLFYLSLPPGSILCLFPCLLFPCFPLPLPDSFFMSFFPHVTCLPLSGSSFPSHSFPQSTSPLTLSLSLFSLCFCVALFFFPLHITFRIFCFPFPSFFLFFSFLLRLLSYFTLPSLFC